MTIRSRHVVVVGGGITGLAAAWEASAAPNTRVTVVESASRLGGKIVTTPVDVLGGTLIDEGADAFLARVPEALELCDELGLSGELIEPAASRAQVWVNGEARYLPADTVLGVPVEFDSLSRSGLVSDEGLRAATAEVDGNWSAPTDDVSIGAFLTERYGRELVDHVVAPLIGGINAGNVDRLSLRAVTPQLATAASRGGSLTAALRQIRDAAPSPAVSGVFRGLRGGTGSLIQALHDQLAERDVTIISGATVDRVTPTPSGAQVIVGRRTIDADAVVITTPASAAAQILADSAPDVSQRLGSITYSSVTLVTLVYRADAFPDLPSELSGVLVPRSAAMLTTAVSVGSNKWPHWVEGAGDTTRLRVLRASVGHSDDDQAARLDAPELLERMIPEITTLLGADHREADHPLKARVSRWLDGFAQYGVGHLSLIDDIESELHELSPRVRIAGASYRGLGIPSCISAGRRAARELIEDL